MRYLMKILFWGGLIVVGIYILLWMLHAGEEISPLRHLSLSYYTHPEEKPFWIADYFPFAIATAFLGANAILFFIELFFVEPSYAPIHDSGNIIRLIQKGVPPMNHLEDALYTCPRMNAETIESELAAQGISTMVRPKWTRSL